MLRELRELVFRAAGGRPGAPTAGTAILYLDKLTRKLRYRTADDDYPIQTSAGGSGAPTTATYVTLTTDATLTQERTLAVGTGLDLVDGGAGSTVTVQLDLSEVSSGGDLGGTMDAPSVAKIGGVAVTVDTDGTLAANSDARLATQKATKTYADAGYRPGGTDIAVADGGTGSSTAAGARLNLGVNRDVIFGTGRDGAVDFDGVTTPVAGATLSGSTYTMTRDIGAANLTVRTGVTVKTVGFKIRATGTLATEGTGTISNNGGDGSGTVGGTSPGTGGPGTLFSAGSAGANGRSTVGAGSGATGTNPSLGGAGGAGGAAAGGSPAGGAGGTVTAPTATNGDIREPPGIYSGLLLTSSGHTGTDAGAGGGGGGHDGVSGNSGAGGGGAGPVYIACDTIDNAGSITANGGAGSAATGSDNGGGGGGGGGWILLLYRATSGSGLGTVQASGGTFGAGSGSGANGSAGSSGSVYSLQLA